MIENFKTAHLVEDPHQKRMKQNNLLVKSYKLRLISLAALIAVMIFNFIPEIYAEDATPSANTTLGLSDKLDALKRELASKAATLKSEIGSKIQNKIYSGTIYSINNKQIVMQTKKGQRTVMINEYTTYLNAENTQTRSTTSIKYSDLQAGDHIITLGEVDDKNQLFAKKLIRSKQSPSVNTSLSLGEIVTYGDGKIVIKYKLSEYKTFQVNQKTVIRSKEGNKTDKEIQPGQTIIFKLSDNSDIINYIFILSYSALQNEKSASDSANFSSASPSANVRNP